MGGPNSEMGGVGSASHIQQTPSTDATDQARTKEVTHEGRTWKQKFDSIKAAIIRILTFSRNKSNKAPAIKKDSITVVKGGAEPSKAELKKQAKADKADKTETPKSGAIVKQEGPKSTAKAKVDETSALMGQKVGGFVAGAVTSVAQTVGHAAVDVILLPRKMTGASKNTQPAETQAAQFQSVIPSQSKNLLSLKEFRENEQTHVSNVVRDQKTLAKMVADLNANKPPLSKALSEEDKKVVKELTEAFTSYAALVEKFGAKLEGTLSSLDKETIDLETVSNDVKELFSSDYGELHKASEKVISFEDKMKSIIIKDAVAQFSAVTSKSKHQFDPVMLPVQRMMRYPMLLTETKRRFSDIDNLPPVVLSDLDAANEVIKTAVKKTNANKRIEQIKFLIKNPKDLKSTVVKEDFHKWLGEEFKIYQERPILEVGADISKEELLEAAKLDTQITLKAIPTLFKQIKKQPVQKQVIESELKNLRFALDQYALGTPKQINKWKKQVDQWQKKLDKM
ncbi:MAG: hypothetical protein CK425_03615 [Parachlamydia sp.]|nr:MAG: hypothetical protein CK425_03615 [Parachlamydia sp.]